MNLLQAEGKIFPWDILKTKTAWVVLWLKASNLLYYCEVFSASSFLPWVSLCRKVPTSQGAAGFRYFWDAGVRLKAVSALHQGLQLMEAPHRTVCHILPSPFPSPSPALWHWQCRANLPLCFYTKMWHFICVSHRKDSILLTFWMLQQWYRHIRAPSSSLELAWPGWALLLHREMFCVSTEMK